MANWRRTVDIQSLIRKYDKDVYEGGPVPKKLVAAVVKLLTGDHDLGRFAARFKRVKTVAGFNRVYSDLCDAADYYLIWLGI